MHPCSVFVFFLALEVYYLFWSLWKWTLLLTYCFCFKKIDILFVCFQHIIGKFTFGKKKFHPFHFVPKVLLSRGASYIWICVSTQPKLFGLLDSSWKSLVPMGQYHRGRSNNFLRITVTPEILSEDSFIPKSTTCNLILSYLHA